MTHRIGEKGQVVIPKDIREELGLRPGVSVDVTVEDGRAVVAVSRPSASPGGKYREGPDMAARLLEDRAREPR